MSKNFQDSTEEKELKHKKEIIAVCKFAIERYLNGQITSDQALVEINNVINKEMLKDV